MSIDLRDEFTKRYGTEQARKFSADERKKAHTMSDGSFPIENASDLKNAIRLAGNSKDPAKARAHIKSRAAKLGLSNLIPDSWKSEKSDLDVEPERAFVLRGDSGRTVITAPVREIAQTNAGFSYLRGRFVEADNPNGNGAMWSSEDLELGAPTVSGGPLNWLHQERKIIGTLLDGELVKSDREAAGSDGVGNHIVSNAVVWKYLFPNETLAIEKAAAGAGAFYSMECISREVSCVDTPGRPGCGESFSYQDYDSGKTCAHLREKSSVRRFVDPLFLGGAIIVPPVMPGWANADVEVMRQAAALTEREGLDGFIEKPEAQAMVAQIMEWANR